MTLPAGTRLGQYEILAPLGAGGMGEVYRARDSRLHREVAIKVLPAETMSDPAARRRFEQEARAIALLSHSNILAIHHFDAQDGISFAVTELLEGETLRDRLGRSTLPWTKAVPIAAAIADGLAAAHEKGIVHRDLKPANIFLTSGGQVKILDFGLARASSPEVSESTTDLKTAPGTVMGTLGYMSPEQLRGETADATTDIFALGCIVYEMIAGRSPFVRSTATETMAAALRDEPAELAASVAPPALMRLIRRCLEKNRNERYQHARDLAFDLRALLTSSETPITNRKTVILAAAVVIVFLVGVLVVMRAQKHPLVTRPEIHSILVVPFENGTRDPGAEYLSDGIAEGLINTLAKLPNLRVVARTTAFQYKGKPLDLQQIRRQLEVDAVLSGRLVSRGNNLIVQADLVDVGAGTELWGGRFHEQSPDLLNIEEGIVGRISDALRLQLTPSQESRISRRSTENPEAYKLYLQGRFYWNKRNPEAIKKAKDLFQQAVTVDPQFALAYSGLADSYNLLGGTYHVLPPEEGRARSEEAVRMALRLDPELAEAHASLGLIEMNQFHWDPAEKELRRAIEINPSYANALLWYSLLLLAQDHLDESLAMVRKAEQLDPLSTIIVTNVANRLNIKGDYAAALPEAQKSAELDPGYVWAYWQMGMAYEGLGQLENAAAAYKRGGEVPGPPGFGEAFLVRANAILGNNAEARRLAQLLEKRAARGEVARLCVGWAYSAVGDRDKAFDWLNRALEAREPPLRDSIRTPFVKELRGDPRYTELLLRLQRGFEN
jgi:TolB-like protein/Tfp pilus assembly protein PilF/tRNA A-37 threonylcarbamoyl transferase component Bud32